jgi:DNA-binding transcriptional LysR family regulator
MANLENFRLVVFRTVAEQQSFRKAAEELYLTQPAVSLQIKALEEDLGVQLFDRSGPHAGLTAAGTVLLKHARSRKSLLSLEIMPADLLSALPPPLRSTFCRACSASFAPNIPAFCPRC